MKPIIISLLLFCQAVGMAQITFEEIAAPNDFGIYAVRKSPVGEYFVQAQNDRESIYTSLNGVQWTKTGLPESLRLDDIQFFSDGTPLLQSDNDEHLIRRNGNWYTMDMTGGFYGVKASCIKDDTLFVFQDNSFGYSLDKGATFKTLFTADEDIIDHTAHLWKFQHYLVLHHTAGASNYLSIYNVTGAGPIFTELGSGIFSTFYNICGQVLITDNNEYYLLKDPSLQLTHGNLSDILPANGDDKELISTNENYYIRIGNTILRSNGCQFNWTPIAQNDVVANSDSYWINGQEDLLLLNRASNIFTEHKNGSATWDEQKPDINFPYIYKVNEAGQDHQFVLTSNDLYHKLTPESQWTKSDSLKRGNYEIQYSPDGDLYINMDTIILYSTNNGIHFDTISVPGGVFQTFGYSMSVLDNDVIFLNSYIGYAYYTLNNGKTWIDLQVSFPFDIPKLKLVGNYIYMADINYLYEVYRVNILTNQVETDDMGGFFSNLITYGFSIQDDGTMYLQAWDPFNGNSVQIFRYRFGEGVEYLPQLDPLANLTFMDVSGSDLFGFQSQSYYVFDGNELQSYSITGLPATTDISFFIAENEYLYAIQGATRIFRSTEPLSYPQYITGTIYHNTPPNCIADTTEATLEYWKVQVKNDHYLRITSSDSDGHFKFSVPKGDFTLSTQPITSNWDVCENEYPVTIDNDHSHVDQDFQAIGLTSCAELEIDFSTPRLRRCFENYYTIQVRNFGPEATAGTTLTLKLDPYFELTSATLPYTLVSDSIVTFDLGILNVNDNVTFKIYFRISCDAEIGTLHCLSGDLTDAHLCGLSRSYYTECQENIGSYDPNDKRIFNDQGNETTAIEKGEFIYYQIRFQNTGTDTAFTVRIVDQLSPMLDLSTLEMLSSSQPYEYEITDGPALAVTFNNILLPDSTTNEAASNGFVKFRVKPFFQYDYGTVIPNQAAIFFDFNAPVLTNQAVLTIQHPVHTKDIRDQIEFDLFPNPTTSSLHLKVPDKFANRVNAYEIMDALGRRLVSGKINSDEIDVANLSSGIYTLVLMHDQKQVGRKQFARM